MYQKVAPGCAAMFSASGLSRHSHTSQAPTSGSEAINAPEPRIAFRHSDAAAISAPEIIDVTAR